MSASEFVEKLKKAAEYDEYLLRDGDGFLFWVDTVDERGIYYHMGGGDTHRASIEQAIQWFEIIEA